MRPVSEMPWEVAAGIRCVLTDIDDTLTTDGRLPAAAYSALERLQDSGLFVAPITGRPAGWCDMIARFWPVDGVVGENGAFYFSYDRHARRMRRVYAEGADDRHRHRGMLDEIRHRVLAEVPGAAVAADQPYRDTDLAIDFREDVPPLPAGSIDRIKAIFEEAGAVAKISSIHVNGWFGGHDKLSMSRRFLAEIPGMDLDVEESRIVFCGDSPNDAPMFAHFSNGCGVANVRDFAGRMEAEPAWVADARGADGFVEISEIILQARTAMATRRPGPQPNRAEIA